MLSMVYNMYAVLCGMWCVMIHSGVDVLSVVCKIYPLWCGKLAGNVECVAS